MTTHLLTYLRLRDVPMLFLMNQQYRQPERSYEAWLVRMSDQPGELANSRYRKWQGT